MSNRNFSVWDGSVATGFAGGTGTENNPYLINTASQLAYLEKVFNDPNAKINIYYSKYYKLTSNIDLNKREWHPIGDESIMPGADYRNLALHFDGDNHTIKGLYIDKPNKTYVGLFGNVRKLSSFKNITIEDGYVSGQTYVAGIVAKLESSVTGGIENCHFSGEVHGYNSVGGIVGQGYGSYLKDCTSSGTIECNDMYGGGIAGYYFGFGSLDISNCINTATVTGGEYMGGISGMGSRVSHYKYCRNSGDIFSKSGPAGGIAGASGHYEYCSNSGNISAIEGTYSYAGGITGNSSDGSIKDCFNSGTITGISYVGGLTGVGQRASISSSKNVGVINGQQWWVGGICGNAAIETTIEYCINESAVNGGRIGRIGGIVGEGYNIKHCHNKGTIKGNQYVAGICGYSESETGSVTDCVNDGFINPSWDAGGIAGSFKGTIQNCINTASIAVSSSAGGIVSKGGKMVKNCYNTGSLKGSTNLGGIVGETLVSGFVFENNYSSGMLSTSNSSGGILGTLRYGGGQIMDCHYHEDSAIKGVGGRMASVSIEDTGYVESAVSRNDLRSMPELLLGSYMKLAIAIPILTWSKKKEMLLRQLSKLVAISSSLGIDQDDTLLTEMSGDDMSVVTGHSLVRESPDETSNIVAMCFKYDIIRVLPKQRSSLEEYHKILLDNGQTGFMPRIAVEGYEVCTTIIPTVIMNHVGGEKLADLSAGVDVIVFKPRETEQVGLVQTWVKVYYKNSSGWCLELALKKKEGSSGVVIAVAGEDKASGHNAFKDNIATYKSDNPSMDVRVIYADEHSSAEQVMQEIITLSKSIDGGISHLRIEAHSDPNGITLKYEDQLVPGSGWDKIAFRNDAFIRFTGCNSGGTDGLKSKDSIAQKVSNKTGKVVYGYVNNTSQKSENGRHFQSPVRMYSGQNVVYDFTKFTPEN